MIRVVDPSDHSKVIYDSSERRFRAQMVERINEYSEIKKKRSSKRKNQDNQEEEQMNQGMQNMNEVVLEIPKHSKISISNRQSGACKRSRTTTTAARSSRSTSPGRR